MATQNFINECKKRANANRLGKFTLGNLVVNQTNYLKSIELKDSCYVDDTIIGSVYTKSADVKLLNLPANTDLVGETITPEIGVDYLDESDPEYITFDDYIIESVNDEQTASGTGFTAMNGGTLLDKQYVCNLSFENGATHTIYEFYEDACDQLGLTPTDATIDNGSLVMTGNPFQNKETIRIVLGEVAKVSCSLIKIDWHNETISLTWLSNQIDYEFTTSDYSTLEGSLEQYGPLNVIVIGNSQLDGENVTKTDSESVALNGEHQIMIDAPYFLYTEALRTQAINTIYNKLDGLTYYDLTLTTPYGKPFLEVGNKIRINTNENQIYDTYVLSHTFTYDGAFKSVIESPALTSEEQKVKNELRSNTIKERMKRTEGIVDKTTGDITAIAQRVTTTEDELGNVYSKDDVDTMIINAENGVVNTFSEAGGNNIFRNTGLWYDNKGQDKATNPYEYWYGIAVRSEDIKANNRAIINLQNTTFYQTQSVANGSYCVSFKYKKTIALANVSVTINGTTYNLTETNDKEFMQTLEVSSNTITVSFTSDTNNACEIYDVMVNAGSVKLAYSQNQNETTTDTVKISKGIEITSTETNTRFRADTDGIRIYNTRSSSSDPTTQYTETGTETNSLKVKDEATILGVKWQIVGNQTWLTKL